MKTSNFPKFKMGNGYTIIETMIAVSLFLVVIMYGTTALLNANVLHKKSGDIRSIIDNLSFIMEDMSRNLRVGYNYHCVSEDDSASQNPANITVPDSCESGYEIAFEHPADGGNMLDDEDQWVYFVETGQIWKSEDGKINSVQLTPEEVKITNTSVFSVLGAESFKDGDEQQPLVTIRLVGNITTKDGVTPFSLQTSVAQRVIDN